MPESHTGLCVIHTIPFSISLQSLCIWLWRQRGKVRNNSRIWSNLLPICWEFFLCFNHSLVASSPCCSHLTLKIHKSDHQICENSRKWEKERAGRDVKKRGGYTVGREKSCNRLLVCSRMDRLGRVNFISQGVVANRRGAGPTMTILHSYYTHIGTLFFTHTSRRSTLNLFLMLVHHSRQPLSFWDRPLLSPRPVWAICTHLEEFQRWLV